MRRSKIRMTIDSDLNNVALVGIAVHAICAQIAKGGELCGQIELALVEAVNNAVIHAYRKYPGKIVVTLELFPEKVVLRVTDNGKSIPPGRLNPSAQMVNPENSSGLSSGGRGFYIISEIMDEVLYEKSESCNVLTMTKKLGMKAK